MAGGIFISYRRDDSRHAAGRLASHLAVKVPREQLFMDVDAIEPGVDFIRVLKDQVAACDAMLVLIGPNWLNAADERGSRRLDDLNDLVRVEIESALQRDIPVVPVLVDGATVPKAEGLPPSLQPLVRRHSVRLSHERFAADADVLVHSLAKFITRPSKPWFRRSPQAAPPRPNQPAPSSVGTRAYSLATIATMLGIVLGWVLILVQIAMISSATYGTNVSMRHFMQLLSNFHLRNIMGGDPFRSRIYIYGLVLVAWVILYLGLRRSQSVTLRFVAIVAVASILSQLCFIAVLGMVFWEVANDENEHLLISSALLLVFLASVLKARLVLRSRPARDGVEGKA